ncbi:hypothetical protein JHK86_042591 [Glycine max]|nr:hypothetical protein JHK86_042591 [Glycine max]
MFPHSRCPPPPDQPVRPIWLPELDRDWHNLRFGSQSKPHSPIAFLGYRLTGRSEFLRGIDASLSQCYCFRIAEFDALCVSPLLWLDP